MIPAYYFFLVSALLFSIGLWLALTRRNALAVLMGIELILNATNLNLITKGIKGQTFVVFVIIVAAAEAAVALAIILLAYQHYQTVNIENVNQLNENSNESND